MIEKPVVGLLTLSLYVIVFLANFFFPYEANEGSPIIIDYITSSFLVLSGISRILVSFFMSTGSIAGIILAAIVEVYGSDKVLRRSMALTNGERTAAIAYLVIFIILLPILQIMTI